MNPMPCFRCAVRCQQRGMWISVVDYLRVIEVCMPFAGQFGGVLLGVVLLRRHGERVRLPDVSLAVRLLV